MEEESDNTDHDSQKSWEKRKENADAIGFPLSQPQNEMTPNVPPELTILCGLTAANEVTITTADELIELSTAVNGGAKYSGTTVFLGADLDFSGKTLAPIGKDWENYFNGTFDGQGHIISNLIISSSNYKCTGLFGVSSGATIRNTVIGNTCSFENTFTTTSSSNAHARTGGITGTGHVCTIESCVNMASVTFSGSVINSGAYLGGISSGLSSSSTCISIIRNCINYGAITYTGKSINLNIGGILGDKWGDYQGYLQNCLNYGTVTQAGTTSAESNLGGITGYTQNSRINNCLSAGKLSITGSASTKYIGSVVGNVYSDTNIYNSYYTSSTGINRLYQGSTPGSITGSSSSALAVPTAVTNLNNKASSNGWNKWILNSNGVAVTFKVNNNKGFSVSSQAILLPDPSATDGNVFSGWYKEAEYKNLFQSTSISSATTLYGLYKIGIKVTFNPNGGSVSTASKKVIYENTYETLPTSTRTGYKFDGWFTAASGGNEIKSSTKVTITAPQTLYAHWTPNTYNVTFDKNGGDSVSKTSTTVTYDNTYGTLPSAERTGYKFNGWFNAKSGGTEIKSSSKVKTANDHSLYAHWTANKYNITFDVNGGDSVSKTTITVTYDSIYGALPSAERTGYDFTGWFTEEEGGDNVTSEDIVKITEDKTLYAHWTANKYTMAPDENEVTITTADELIEFSTAVNGGVNYSGTTVFLGADLDFTGKTFLPIGNNFTTLFVGTFDGQGHIISNLKTKFSGEYAGLFGITDGATVKNVVMDSTCSIESTSSSSSSESFSFAGGIVGYCSSISGSCTIESNVNMASVTFSGITNGQIYVGGISSCLHFVTYEFYVKNCANYGTISVTGTSYHSDVGGIVGECWGDAIIKYVQNCINYGTVTHTGRSGKNLCLGGIVGLAQNAYVDNCLSAGKLFGGGTVASEKLIGSIIGWTTSKSSINYCYYTSDTGVNRLHQGLSPSVTGSPSSASAVSTAVTNLNNRASSNGWNKWITNSNGVAVTFKVNDNKGFSVSSQAVLLPDPSATDGNVFSGWYKDAVYKNLFQSTSVSSATTLYGLYKIGIKVTFDVNDGGSVSTASKKVSYYSTYGDLPEPERTGYTFVGWFTEEEGGDKIEPTTKVNITAPQTIYAHWTANKYTITFNTTTANGDVLQQPSQQGTYDSEYGALPEPERTGYTFAGWFTEEDGQGERITEGTNVSIAANHTLYAHWDINNYTIRFEYGNGADAEERVLDFNERIEYTEGLVRDGYTFAGWDMKPDTVPAEDLTIRALWTANNYTLSFDGCGGEGVGNEKKNVTYDSTYGILPEPTRTGYTFVGWFTEEGGQGDKIETGGQVKVTGDVTLYAKWSINQYNITFSVEGGSECTSITQDYNTAIELPEPTKTGYTFDCWCSDPELSREYSETTMPAGNVTLYAKWSINQYNLTFVFNNGAENEVRTLDYNEEIVYPENIEKTGYTFNGWDNKPERMPAENITITTQWVSIGEPSNPTEYVEIVFGKDFTKEEVKDILDDYTKEGFTIVEFEKDEKSRETRVIVKFNDRKDAEEFVDNIDKNGKEEHFFRDFDFASGKSSFSLVLVPLSLLYSLF